MADDKPDLYADLGIDRAASPAEIKRAHRKAVNQHHPDRGGDKARFQAVQLAYDTLKDEARRGRYDQTGETAGASNDPALQMLGQILEGLISQMLQEGAPIETIDMRKMMADSIAGKIREISHERVKAERAAKKAAELARRWKRKHTAAAPDLIGDTIRRRERDIKEALARMSEAIVAWGRAAKMLDDYEYEVDAQPSGMTIHSPNGFQFVEFGRPE